MDYVVAISSGITDLLNDLYEIEAIEDELS